MVASISIRNKKSSDGCAYLVYLQRKGQQEPDGKGSDDDRRPPRQPGDFVEANEAPLSLGDEGRLGQAPEHSCLPLEPLVDGEVPCWCTAIRETMVSPSKKTIRRIRQVWAIFR